MVSRTLAKQRALVLLVLCSSFSLRAHAYSPRDDSTKDAGSAYMLSSGFILDGFAPEVYDKFDPFAGVFGGLPLDLNTGIQMLVDGSLAAAKVADRIAGVVANQAANFLYTIDFDELVARTKRTIEDKSGPMDDRTIYLIGIGVALGILSAGVLTAIVLYVGLPALGFTAGGVAQGSIAAAWQSTLGNVAVGSLFALLQSAGAGGAGAYVVGSISAVVGGLAGAAAGAAFGRQSAM
ncbi:hypothetical protein F503_03188 [Ophiostoma piceae UAMH 11346]|uniref:Uncharacterized protein n=1 Tax=Ophiostoma piceae (strain UAMH 11346) TaxID=1262450 RepID=S3C4L1_OPHP1|nr:hypothetical protein F503_03188 [Ophiostoma piceae UAMH 11346]